MWKTFAAFLGPMLLSNILQSLSGTIGVNGIWIAYPVTFAAMLGLQTAYYRLVWKKPSIRRLV